MGHHHCASVTVSAVKFVCANTNLLTYLPRKATRLKGVESDASARPRVTLTFDLLCRSFYDTMGSYCNRPCRSGENSLDGS